MSGESQMLLPEDSKSQHKQVPLDEDDIKIPIRDEIKKDDEDDEQDNIVLEKAQLSWRGILTALGLGQVLSLLITGTAVTSQLLVERHSVNIPTTQSVLNYVFLSIVWIPILFYREGRAGVCNIARERIWKYLVLALIDVEANFLVVKAYQYTNITSVTLLDCFTIPMVMFWGWLFIKTSFNWRHFVGVATAVLGMVAVVLSDYYYNPKGDAKDPLLGDILVLIGATCYSISNSGQEALVKTHSKVEWLAFIGFFGSIISSIQMGIFEHSELKSLHWNAHVVFLILGFAVCLFLMYSLTPWMLQCSSATLFNLSLLTSDGFVIIIGIFLFSLNLSAIYFIGVFVIVFGLIIYNTSPESATLRSDFAYFRQRFLSKIVS